MNNKNKKTNEKSKPLIDLKTILKNPFTNQLSPNIRHLIIQTSYLEQSIEWWAGEVDKLVLEFDELEKQSFLPDFDEKMGKLLKKMSTLLARSQIEIDNLEKLEAEIVSEIKNADRAKPTKRSPKKSNKKKK